MNTSTNLFDALLSRVEPHPVGMIATLAHIAQNWESVGNEFLRTFKDYPYFLAAIKGIRNGLIYGTRIRAPHAFVMVFLFGQGTLLEKILTILRLTRIHAMNLAKFAFSFRLVKEFLMRIDGTKGHPREWQSFVAGAIVGYFVFGDDNSVNMQVNMYLLSRITIGLAKLLVKKEVIPQPKFKVFPVYAAFCWGVVLWLFEHYTDVLQGSLISSMTYLYKDSNYWTDFKTFMIRNK
ncbi:hypothetical protein RB195_003303 [Necator americanus]|uniref:Peroxisomal membrane protein 4 n=1 Tax=Necator americanus TaxID=51031 RepID=A0ABR1DN01_NECAM